MSSFRIFEIGASALSAQSVRLNTVASNLANADSISGDPNTVYKARDIDFRKALEDASAGRTPTVQLAQTARSHVQAAGAATPGAGNPLYRTVVQASLDGNTVDMDVERAQFAENAIRYEANLTFINSQLKALLAAIQG